MSENESDPFDKFIVDENEPMDKQLVVDIVKPYVESIGKNKVIEYSEKFNKSSAWVKILVYLCCRKIMSGKNIVESEEVGPIEIAEDTGISKGSALDVSRDKNLVKLVSKNKQGYFIPNHKLKQVKIKVNENG